MSEEIPWGIVGPGRIAENLVQDFAVVDGARELLSRLLAAGLRVRKPRGA